jgi:hypothetical protein
MGAATLGMAEVTERLLSLKYQSIVGASRVPYN